MKEPYTFIYHIITNLLTENIIMVHTEKMRAAD